MARLQVELPCCEVCGHVSKLPAGFFSGKSFCTGPIENRHKRTPMKPRVFREVAAPAEVEATRG